MKDILAHGGFIIILAVIATLAVVVACRIADSLFWPPKPPLLIEAKASSTVVCQVLPPYPPKPTPTRERIA